MDWKDTDMTTGAEDENGTEQTAQTAQQETVPQDAPASPTPETMPPEESAVLPQETETCDADDACPQQNVPSEDAGELSEREDASEGETQPPVAETSAEERIDAPEAPQSQSACPPQTEPMLHYRWNYETQRATDERSNHKKSRSGIVTYAAVMTVFFAASLTLLVLSLLTGGLTPNSVAGDAGNSSPVISDRVVYIRDEDDQSGLLTIQEIAEQSKPGVVAVSVRTATGGGIGTGFVVREDGYIVTNYHVVEDAQTVQVTLYGGTSYDAEVVNSSEPDDLAVLKIAATGLTALPIGNSDQLLVGDEVVVLGHPAGLEYGWSTTNGILSGINREIKIKDNNGSLIKTMTLLQTNANVNQGNSGGPMFNERGEVIGIISMKLANGYEGMGLAIPINGAMEIINAIIEQGSADHVDSSVSQRPPVLGVTGRDVQKGYLLTLRDNGTYSYIPQSAAPETPEGRAFPIEHDGFFVFSTSEGSGADGKLLEGDIIVAVDGEDALTHAAVVAALNEKKAGDTVEIGYVRDGEVHTVTITLSAAQ